MPTIEEIEIARGQARANQLRQRGGNWMPLIQYAAQLPNQIRDDRQAERQAQIAAQQAAEDRAIKLAQQQQGLEKGGLEIQGLQRTAQKADEEQGHAERVRKVFSAPGVIDPQTGKPDFEKALQVAAEQGVDPLEIVTAVNATLSDYAKRVKAEMDAQPKPEAPIKVGPNETLLDPTTHQPIYTAPKPEEFVTMTVKGPNGRPVRVQVPATQLRSGGVEEYREPTKPEDPLDRRKRELELAKLEREAAGGNIQLTATQKDELALMDTVAGMGNQILADGLKNNWAGVGGLHSGSIQQWMAKNLGTGSQQEQSLRNLIGNVKSTIAKLRGGTALTPQELALIDTYTPTIDDSPKMIQSKVTSLNDFISQKKQALLKVAAGDYSDPTPRNTTQSGPAIGEERIIRGVPAKWDGRGWVAK